MKNSMVINVHAGHNPDGKIACGAVGFLRESTEARRVKDEVISRLRQLGHTVYDCTCENGTSQADVLKKIVAACNAHRADLDISIHFNSGVKDSAGNGRTTGTEAYVFDKGGRAAEYAEKICRDISSAGFRNRGVKENKSLYFLKNTNAPAVLVECCFVDDRDDAQCYDYLKMARAIVYGITGKECTDTGKHDTKDEIISGTPSGTGRQLSRVQVGAYSVPENAARMRDRLKAAGFTDAIVVKA